MNDQNTLGADGVSVYGFDIDSIKGEEFRENRDTGRRNGHVLELCEFLSEEGIYFMHGCLQSEKDGYFKIEAPAPYIHLFYSLKYDRSYSVAGKTFVQYGNMEHNILFFPAGEIETRWSQGDHIEFFEICVSLDFFLSRFRHPAELIELFKNKIDSKTASTLFPDNMPITPEIKTVLHDILSSKVCSDQKGLLLQAKVIELVVLQLSQYTEMKCREEVIADLSDEDISRMHKARDIILDTINNPYSTSELAQLVGTNETYLKKYFKMVFGQTVFAYINEIRMRQAHDILIQKNRTVSEVAYFMGYKHSSHFSYAFKKHFGVSPSEVINKD